MSVTLLGWMPQLDPATLDSADKVFHMVIAVGVLAAGFVGSRIRTALKEIRSETKIEFGKLRSQQSLEFGKIRAEQASAKSELVEHQNEIKEELNQKHAENQEEIRVHTARDEVQFSAIATTNSRMETKLDKLVDWMINGSKA